MIERRRKPRPSGARISMPSSSGPRCSSVRVMRVSSSRDGVARGSFKAMPEKPPPASTSPRGAPAASETDRAAPLAATARARGRFDDALFHLAARDRAEDRDDRDEVIEEVEVRAVEEEAADDERGE